MIFIIICIRLICILLSIIARCKCQEKNTVQQVTHIGNWENSDYSFYQNYLKLVGKVGLSRPTNRSIKQINFIGKLAEDDWVKIFYYWKAAKRYSKPLLMYSRMYSGTSRILNSLNKANDYIFMTKKWILLMINQTKILIEEMRLSNTEVLKSNLCNCNNVYAYILKQCQYHY